MTTGSTATIVAVGKPLPESLVGQQVEIMRFISPSFPAVRTADGREYIMDISRLDFGEVEHPELCGWQGKRYFSALELTRLPGMPTTVAEIQKLAKQQQWKDSPYAGESQYYFGDFPDETKTYFLAKWFRACEQEGSGIQLSEEEILSMTCDRCGEPHLNRFTQSEAGKTCFRCATEEKPKSVKIFDLVDVGGQRGWIYRLLSDEIAEVGIEGELHEVKLNQITPRDTTQSTSWLESGIWHHRRYARWLLGVRGAYQRSSREFENKDKYLATLKREAKRLLKEARKLEAKLC
jgi:hypothetical protein